jgi:hypothetical protein
MASRSTDDHGADEYERKMLQASPELDDSKSSRVIARMPRLTKRECKEDFPKILRDVAEIGLKLGFVVVPKVFFKKDLRLVL